MLLIGRKSIPGASPKDYVAWIKEQGAKANFAHGGIGTNSHLCAVMMGDVLGFRPTVVAYRGSAPAITDLLGGQVDLLWDQVTNAITQVQAGALHGIAVTSPQRLEQLKDVPTTAELGMPEVSYTMWHGLYVAKGTPKEAVAALNAALRKAVSSSRAVVAKLKDLGTVPFPAAEMSPAGARQAVRQRPAAGGEAGGKLGDQAERGEVAAAISTRASTGAQTRRQRH